MQKSLAFEKRQRSEDSMKIRLWLSILATSAVFTATSIPSEAATALTPYAQMKQVIADANAELSVRVTTTALMSGVKIVQVTDAGRNEGRQTVAVVPTGTSNSAIAAQIAGRVFKKGTAPIDAVTAELIAGNVYVMGDATMLTTYMGLTQSDANELAGQWFGIPQGSSFYANVAQGLTISSGMAEVTMTASVTSAPASVDVLKGTSVASALQPSYKETLHFSAAKRPLPVEVTQSVKGASGTILFSHWNEKIYLAAPSVTLYLN
jgi:hypothetical protein